MSGSADLKGFDVRQPAVLRGLGESSPVCFERLPRQGMVRAPTRIELPL
jgi:hypothetical protein